MVPSHLRQEVLPCHTTPLSVGDPTASMCGQKLRSHLLWEVLGVCLAPTRAMGLKLGPCATESKFPTIKPTLIGVMLVPSIAQ